MITWTGRGCSRSAGSSAERRLKGRVERETVYYITSLPRTLAGPEDLLTLARDHWGAIENGLHYVRDEVLGEDRSTIRTRPRAAEPGGAAQRRC